MKNFSLITVIFFVGFSSSLMSMETMPKRVYETTEACVKKLMAGTEFSIPGMSTLISFIKQYRRKIIIINQELPQDFGGGVSPQICEHVQELAQIFEKIKQHASQDNLEQKDRIILNQYGFSHGDIAEKENALRVLIGLEYPRKKHYQKEREAYLLQQLTRVSTAGDLMCYIKYTIVPTIEKYNIEISTLLPTLEMYQQQWDCNLLLVAKVILEDFHQKLPRQTPPQSIMRFARALRLIYIKHKIKIIDQKVLDQKVLILEDFAQSQSIGTLVEA